MPLKSKLFTQPKRDSRLEDCLVEDAKHITQGSRGEHVEKIQTALNRLSEGPGRENFNLPVSGWYGPETAAAVKRYKNAPSRRILQPWQTTADNIVGKRTIESLDNEMDILENQSIGTDTLFSSTDFGAPHDHSKCPTGAQGAEDLGPDGIVSHRGTPINPVGTRRINIFGAHETDYLGFTDYASDPKYLGTRPYTKDKIRGLSDHSVSDICMRSSPLDKITQDEIIRISMLGCRLTFASASPQELYWSFLQTLGPIIAHGEIARGMHVVVVQMLFHIRK